MQRYSQKFRSTPILDKINYVLRVPSDFSTINDACTYLESYNIKYDVTIQVSDGTYSQDQINGITIGDKVKILGNVTTPTNCMINFTNHGISLSNRRIKYINGFYLKGNRSSNKHGIILKTSEIIFGTKMKITDFDTGLYIYNRSYCEMPYAIIQDNVNFGIITYNHSTTSANNGLVKNSGLGGVSIQHCGYLEMSDATVEDNTGLGIAIALFSEAYTNRTISRRNLHGFYCGKQSFIDAANSISTNNTQQGYYCINRSHIVVGGSTANNNGSGNYSPTTGSEGNYGALISNNT